MQSSSLKLFPNYEQKAMLLKRQAFAIFSGELDQYHMYLPLIQGIGSPLNYYFMVKWVSGLTFGHSSDVIF